MDKLLKIFNVKWTSINAGPSPDDNKRTEIFLAGCKKAASGNPCPKCFNPQTWDENNNVSTCTAEEASNIIMAYAPNKYITFVGGEPLDQIEPLAELCSILKRNGYHILVFTHYTLEEVSAFPSVPLLLNSIDVLVEGEYIDEMRIYDENFEDGLHNAVGSGNQIIWDIAEWRIKKQQYIDGIAAEDLAGLCITVADNRLIYITKDDLCTTYHCLMEENCNERIAG